MSAVIPKPAAAAHAGRTRSRLSGVIGRHFYTVGMTLLVLAIWQLGVQLLHIPDFLLPSPSDILRTLVADWRSIGLNLLPTFAEILGGFLLSICIGIPIAVLIVFSPIAERVLYPPLVASQAVPKIAVAPLFVVWMGYGLTPKIWIAFLIAFFPIVIDTVSGLRSIQPEMLQLGRSMGGGTLRVFLKLRMPNALPHLFSGLKVAVTLAVVGAITGEFVGSQSGLGYLLTSASGQMETDLVFAVLAVISIMAMLLFMVIELLEKLTIPWHSSMRSRNVGER